MAINERDRLHRLVDSLAPQDLPAALRFLEYLQDVASPLDDPVRQALARAAVDDEPDSPEDAALTQEALDAIRQGTVHCHKDVKREFGLA